MKTFEEYLNEAADGDCLLVAGRGNAFFDLGKDDVAVALSKAGAQAKQLKTVHAYVSGQLQLEGKRFVHAWIEYNNKVYDFSNGKSAVLNKELYYTVGGIDPSNKKEYHSYTNDQVTKKIISTGHWGPWDI